MNFGIGKKKECNVRIYKVAARLSLNENVILELDK